MEAFLGCGVSREGSGTRNICFDSCGIAILFSLLYSKCTFDVGR